MPIDIPDLDELTGRGSDSFKGAFPDDDSSQTGDNFKLIRTMALAILQLNHHLKVVADDLMVDRAAGAFLERHGFIFNVAKKGSTPARKADALRVVGVAGSTVIIGDQLQSDGGLIFQVNENATVPAAGFIDVDVIGVSTGSQTKLQAGEVLSFIAAPAGIEVDAELQLDLDEDGTDTESDGDYQPRILNAIRQPGAGGNRNDYEQFALAESGIATAYIYPLRAGKGTVDVAALHAGTGTVRPLTTPERASLFTAIDAKRPVSLKSNASIRLLDTTTSLQNVDIRVTPLDDAQFTFDWDDSGGFTVASYVSATKTLTFPVGTRPTDLVAGDRIVIRTAAGNGTGEVLVAEQLSGADSVILDKDPSPAPVATDNVHAGGPLTGTVRTALLALIDKFGPARGSFASGDWVSDLQPERLLATALQVAGVAAGSVITPVATVVASDPSFPADATIELLIPQEIVVRKQ